MKHLKEQNVGYFTHWFRAMKCSFALFIHAFIPSLFPHYASSKLFDTEE
jgi:hypothetical protein